MVNMDILKDNVGKKAADLIKDGQIVGLGTTIPIPLRV